jgi:outer membrane immunogenic protein
VYRHFATTAIVLGLSSGLPLVIASAADLSAPASAPVYTKAPEPAWSWTGFYLGANAGYAWGQSDFATDPGCPPATSNSTFCNAPPSPFAPNGSAVAAAGSGSLKSSGFTGGVSAGGNWQAGTLVYGGEADFDALQLKRTIVTTGTFPVAFLGNQFTLTETAGTDWLGTLRARLGLTVMPNVLLYATGGAAFTDFRFSSSYSDNAIGGGLPGGTGYGSSSSMSAGWTAGGGLEWAVVKNWTVKAEYLFVDFPYKSFAVPTSNTPTFSQTMQVKTDLSASLARVGVNYKF